MFRIGQILAVLFFISDAASAQGRWEAFDNPQTGLRGASICPHMDDELGHYFCVFLTCAADQPFSIGIDIVGSSSAAETAIAAFSVDGTSAANVMMGRTAERSLFAPVTDELTILIERLKDGRTAEVSIFEETVVVAASSFSLRGSSNAIDTAFAMCGVETPAKPALLPDDPAAMALAKIQTDCADLGGQGSAGPGFVSLLDLNADGLGDVALDYGFAQCTASASLYCGSGGCNTEFWLGDSNGQFRNVYSGLLRDWTVRAPGVLTLSLHGSACDTIGAETCNINIGFGPDETIRLD